LCRWFNSALGHPSLCAHPLPAISDCFSEVRLSRGIRSAARERLKPGMMPDLLEL
jgi:hypothetical protein